MGADLYITRLENQVLKKYPYPVWNTTTHEWVGDWSEHFEEREAMRKELGCYYRDSYNCSNLLWLLGLSYWEIDRERTFDFHKNGNLSVKGVRQLLNCIHEKKDEFNRLLKNIPELKRKLGEFCDTSDMDGWVDYFQKKYVRFETFLNRALEVKSSIVWSV